MRYWWNLHIADRFWALVVGFKTLWDRPLRDAVIMCDNLIDRELAKTEDGIVIRLVCADGFVGFGAMLKNPPPPPATVTMDSTSTTGTLGQTVHWDLRH